MVNNMTERFAVDADNESGAERKETPFFDFVDFSTRNRAKALACNALAAALDRRDAALAETAHQVVGQALSADMQGESNA
jgi:hypothetical protein